MSVACERLQSKKSIHLSSALAGGSESRRLNAEARADYAVACAGAEVSRAGWGPGPHVR